MLETSGTLLGEVMEKKQNWLSENYSGVIDKVKINERVRGAASSQSQSLVRFTFPRFFPSSYKVFLHRKHIPKVLCEKLSLQESLQVSGPHNMVNEDS